MNTERHIIIIGGNHHNTLGVLRALGQKKLKGKIHLIIDSVYPSFVAKSRYIKSQNVHFVSTEYNIKDCIINISMSLREKPVVICCGDHYINAIDSFYNELCQYCLLPNANNEEGRISLFLNKERQASLALLCGLTPPRYTQLKINELDPLSIKLPCIFKPTNSTLGDKSFIKICKDKQAVEAYKNMMPQDFLIKVEEYIDKIMEYQLIGCSLKQEIIIPGYTFIIRQPKNTNTGYLKYSSIEDGIISKELISKVKFFISKIGYVGLFSVEFIRDENGKDFFLEINMRNDGNAYCVTTSGVNLPYIWYKYCDKPIDKITEPITFKKPIFWMPEADAKNIKKVGVFKWLSEWFKADSHAITSISDMGPILFLLLSKIRSIFKK